MHDDPGALPDHCGEDGPVEPDRCEEIGVQGVHPVLVGEGERAAWLGEGSSDAVHHDVEPAEDPDRPVGNEVRASGCGKVGLDQPRRAVRGRMPGGHQDACVPRGEQFGDGCAHATRPAGYERSLAVEGSCRVLNAVRLRDISPGLT